MSSLPQEDYDYAKVIGRNLQRLINEQGTTQSALARKLGIGASVIGTYICKWLDDRNKGKPSMKESREGGTLPGFRYAGILRIS